MGITKGFNFKIYILKFLLNFILKNKIQDKHIIGKNNNNNNR
jgi:hypothetical protein